jgi:glycosyltransferase involved in cell wall biosynthesis
VPSLSIVIPTFQRQCALVRALVALEHQDLPADAFEVIVSIDGSSDRTGEAVESFDASYDLRNVAGPRRGRAAACNAAIRLARGEVILVLDDDMEPAPHCLRAHRRHHPPNSRCCVMGAVPIQIDPTAPYAARFIARKFNTHLEKLAEPDHAFVLRDFYSGNTSIRRDVLFEVGLFDEGFTQYGNEDLELSLRLRRANVKLRYDADALARQSYEKNLTELARDTSEKGRTAVLLARSHPEAFRELQLATYSARSTLWRSARAALLALTRGRPAAEGFVLRLARGLERVGFGRRPLFYESLLDYVYWTGVVSALDDFPDEGPLAQLASDLRDGPLRLLFH